MLLRAFLTILLCTLLPQGAQAQQGAGGPPMAPKVTVTTPLVEDVAETKEFAGRFEATDSVEIRARVNGYLTQSPFKEGAIVTAGDTLFVIDPRPFEAALKKADADVKVAQSAINYTESTYNRAEALFKTGDISAQIRDQRLQERDQAKAELDRTKAAREQAALDLAYTVIKAPIGGRIGQKLISDGNLVTAGQTLLTTLVSMDPIYFYFDVDEQTYLDYARKHPDQKKENLEIPASVSLSDETDFRHEGTIDFIDNAINTGTGTMRARAVLKNDKMYFTPGMFGRIQVKIGTLPKAILVPDSAIMTDQSRKFVYTVAADGTAMSQTVTIGGLAHDNLRVILSGLGGTEQVIINGLQRARDGVKVTAEAAPAITEAAAEKPETPLSPAAKTPETPEPEGEPAQTPAQAGPEAKPE